MKRSLFYKLLLVIASASGFSSDSGSYKKLKRRVLVVGKIIIDEYRTPQQQPSEALISIGGGGPQAAFGAAAALAILSGDRQDPPSPQPVTFVGPIGAADWTEHEQKALKRILAPALDGIHLFGEETLRTPRIQLWHDSNQDVQWLPLYDSLGAQGADALWRKRPCANDIIEVLGDSDNMSCHVVLEGGANSPGNGEDCAFLLDSRVRKRLGFLGVEPVVFQDPDTNRVSKADTQACLERLDRISAFLDFVSPDVHLFREVELNYWKDLDVAVRKGPQGCLLVERDGKESSIPAAALATPVGEPINPTGAGNSFAAAFTACRGSGVSALDSACIASAVGAVFCEYEHIPPWNAAVLSRIRHAAKEIGNEVLADVTGRPNS